MRTHVKYVGEREASETGINTPFNSANCLLAEIRELDATIYTRVVEYALSDPVDYVSITLLAVRAASG